jgi:hypothetical protein
MKPSFHVLFTLYHIHCKVRKNETSSQDVIGYGILPLFSPEGESLLLQDTNEEGEVSVMLHDGVHEIMIQVGGSMVDAYAAYTKREHAQGNAADSTGTGTGRSRADSRASYGGSLSSKLSFLQLQVATRLRSSLYTQDPPLNRFLVSYGKLATGGNIEAHACSKCVCVEGGGGAGRERGRKETRFRESACLLRQRARLGSLVWSIGRDDLAMDR